MKKENTKKPLANLKKSYRKLSVVQKMILFIGLMFIVISTLPAVMVLLIGLLPTFTILITDPKNTDKLVIVGSFNLAGVFIYLMSIINTFTIHNAFFIVGDIFNLIIMLGSAGLGLVAYYEIPNLFYATNTNPVYIPFQSLGTEKAQEYRRQTDASGRRLGFRTH